MNPVTYHDGRWEQSRPNVIREQAVALTVNNTAWLSFMCSPIDLEDLAIGFLFNEEVILSINEIASVRVCPNNDNIDVWLIHAVERPEQWTRTSGCSGGTTSMNNRIKRLTSNLSTDLIRNGAMLKAETVTSLISQLLAAQELYRQSGGVHTSALSDGEEILVAAEDIGRHNTLDKLAGRCLRENIYMDGRIILTTGRISSEMIQKAARMRACVVISRTSPTSLSVQIADELGITLIGYARRDRFTIYTHPERILSNPEREKLKVRQDDE